MRKKAFTLIELLAVITILGIVAIITTPIITSSINASKEKAYDRQKELIEKAAETYVNENILTFSANRICVQSLIDEGYLKNSEIKNPSDKTENMKEGCVSVDKSNSKNYKYSYKKKSLCSPAC